MFKTYVTIPELEKPHFNCSLVLTQILLNIFGTVCSFYMQIKNKPDVRSKKTIFVGYDKDSPTSLVFFHMPCCFRMQVIMAVLPFAILCGAYSVTNSLKHI